MGRAVAANLVSEGQSSLLHGKQQGKGTESTLISVSLPAISLRLQRLTVLLPYCADQGFIVGPQGNYRLEQGAIAGAQATCLVAASDAELATDPLKSTPAGFSQHSAQAREQPF